MTDRYAESQVPWDDYLENGSVALEWLATYEVGDTMPTTKTSDRPKASARTFRPMFRSIVSGDWEPLPAHLQNDLEAFFEMSPVAAEAVHDSSIPPHSYEARVGSMALDASDSDISKSEAVSSVNKFDSLHISPETKAGIDTIVSSITHRAIFGKFPTGVVLATPGFPEMTINHTPFDDFEIYPKAWDSGRTVASYVGQTINEESSRKPYDQHHYITRYPLSQSEYGDLVTYKFPTDYRDRSDRPSHYAEIILAMPTESANSLFSLVREQPDAAEAFFQSIAPGLERTDDTVGVGRKKVGDVALVDLTELAYDAHLPTSHPSKRTLEPRNRIIRTFDTALQQKLAYSRPFGNY